MESKELIQALRSDAEWAHANEWETPITLSDHLDAAADALEALLSVTAELDALKERTRAERDGQLYTVHDVAVILASAIGDDCACNINSNDEWLPQLCELQEACPHPVGVDCWEKSLKHHAEAEKALRKWAQS